MLDLWLDDGWECHGCLFVETGVVVGDCVTGKEYFERPVTPDWSVGGRFRIPRLLGGFVLSYAGRVVGGSYCLVYVGLELDTLLKFSQPLRC